MDDAVITIILPVILVVISNIIMSCVFLKKKHNVGHQFIELMSEIPNPVNPKTEDQLKSIGPQTKSSKSAKEISDVTVGLPEHPDVVILPDGSKSFDVLSNKPILPVRGRLFVSKDKVLDPIAYGIGESVLNDIEHPEPCLRMSFDVVQKMKIELPDCVQSFPVDNCNCNIQNYDNITGTREMTSLEFYTFMKTGLMEILNEFQHLGNPPDSLLLAKNVVKLGPKDRYFDIPLIKKTAVKIFDGTKKCYIHANHVDGYHHSSQFICCQAPLHNTTVDFWKMFWQAKSLIIVQLTRFKEMGVDKCYMYWPDGLGMSIKYADIEVTNNGFVYKEESFAITKLMVTSGGMSRIVYHCFYLRWPDQSVPNDPTTVLSFILKIKELKRKLVVLKNDKEGCKLGSPDIVHCSAGVGRTGTYCAIQISIQRLHQLGTINIQTVVTNIRRQRYSSVQEKAQYMFIYVTMLYYIIDNKYVGRQC